MLPTADCIASAVVCECGHHPLCFQQNPLPTNTREKDVHTPFRETRPSACVRPSFIAVWHPSPRRFVLTLMNSVGGSFVSSSYLDLARCGKPLAFYLFGGDGEHSKFSLVMFQAGMWGESPTTSLCITYDTTEHTKFPFSQVEHSECASVCLDGVPSLSEGPMIACLESDRGGCSHIVASCTLVFAVLETL